MDKPDNSENCKPSMPASISTVRNCLFWLIGDLLLIQLLSFQTRSGIALLLPTLLFVWIWFDVTQKILADKRKRKWARRALHFWGALGILGDLYFALGRWAEYDSARLINAATKHGTSIQVANNGNGVLVVLAGLYLLAAILLIVAISAVNNSMSKQWIDPDSGTLPLPSSPPQSSSTSESLQEEEPLMVEFIDDIPTKQHSGKRGVAYKNNSTPKPFKNSKRHQVFPILLPVLILGTGIVCLVFAGMQDIKAGSVRSVTLPGGVSMRFRRCPAGTFMMGSPDWEAGRNDNVETRHSVTLSDGFWIGETEVTQGQWKALMNGETIYALVQKGLLDNRCYQFVENESQTWRDYMGYRIDADPKSVCGDLSWDVPIYYVTWQEACRFCAILTAQERQAGRLPKGYEYRLPTEAEWEYACRAGTTTSLPNGKEIEIYGERNAPALNTIAWYAGNSSMDFYGRGWDTSNWKEKQFPGGYAGPHQVMTKQPNNWGIYDMIGNVFEWCLDKEDDSSNRIVKGGGWKMSVKWCRPSSRGHIEPAYRDNWLGFRVALAPVQK